MTTSIAPAGVDHYLIAKVQARATGADAHAVHAALGVYLVACDLVSTDPAMQPYVDTVERRLRAFCNTGHLPTTAAMRAAGS